MTRKGQKMTKALGLIPALALVVSVTAAVPVAAKDYTRSCSASIRFGPEGGGTSVQHSFTGKGTERTYRPNSAREKARRNIDECLDAHFADPHGLRPNACTPANQVYDYPFRRLHQEMAMQACNANPGRANLRLNANVVYTGQKGCTLSNNSWNRTLVRNYAVTCATARDYEPGTDRPGMDYRHFQTHSGWQVCQQRCDGEAQCQAWTYTAPTTPDGPGTCWLKNGVPPQRPCSNCTSGVKIQLH